MQVIIKLTDDIDVQKIIIENTENPEEVKITIFDELNEGDENFSLSAIFNIEELKHALRKISVK